MPEQIYLLHTKCTIIRSEKAQFIIFLFIETGDLRKNLLFALLELFKYKIYAHHASGKKECYSTSSLTDSMHTNSKVESP
jgi:hypothetical protein